MRVTSLKKALSVFLAAALSASLAACSSTTSVSSSAPSSSTTGSSSKEAKGPVTVEWLAYNTYGQPDPESEIIKTLEEKYNIQFDFWFVDDEQWDQVLGVRFAAGEMPDVLKIKSTSVVEKYVKQGILAPFTEDMLAKIPSITSAIDEYGGSDMTIDGMYQGDLYVLKTINLNGSYPTTLVWRTDWLKKVGIEKIPTTLDEWEAAMYAFRNDDPDGNGVKDTYGMSSTTIGAVFGAFGAIPLGSFSGTGSPDMPWIYRDGKYTYAATQPEMKDALTYLSKWYADGLIDPEFITGENTGGYWAVSQVFSNGRIGVTGNSMAYHWNPPLFDGASGGACYTDFIGVNPNAIFGETFDLGTAPVGPNGSSGTPCWGAISGTGISFTTQCVANPDKVDAILAMYEDLFTNYDSYILGAYGVKDVNYVIDSKSGQIVPTEDYVDTAKAAQAGIGVTTAMMRNPEFEKKANPLFYDFMDKYKSTGYTGALVPMTESNTQYGSDIKKFALENYIKFITGERPVSEFDDFVKELYANGGQQIEDNTNAAVNVLLGK